MHTILITGASGGLGNQLVKRYLKLGYRVFGTDLKQTDTITELLKAHPEQFSFFAADVTRDEAVGALAQWIRESAASLDIILNAVGILFPGSVNKLENFDVGASLKTFDINTLGPLRVIKACLGLVRAGGEKMIVNISSEAGSLATQNNYTDRYDYCMSKAALNMESVILQRYIRPEGIRVLLVHPGWMKTDMGGARAPLPPETAAESISRLIQAKEQEKEIDLQAMFFDYDGTPRAW